MPARTSGKAPSHADVAWIDANRDALRVKWGIDPCAAVTTGRPSGVGESTAATATAMALRLPDGSWQPLHRADDPLGDAHAWLAGAAAADAVSPTTVCVIGAGAGWIVDAIDERFPAARILVLEPEPTCVLLMLARRDYRPLVEAGRLLVLSGPAFHGAAAAWRMFGRTIAAPLLLIHPVIAVARREATVAAARVVRQALADAAANDTARRRFAAPYLLNTLGNVPTLVRESDVAALFGACTGRAVVVAGAGPSLNRNLDELRPLRDRVVLVAADTALRPCLAAGVAPDIVVAVDPGVANARQLSGLPPCHSTALVAEASLRPAALESFAGRTWFYRVATHHPWPWLRRQGVDVALLHAWGSVLVTAFDLAVRLGGDPVVFIGADLAFTDGQPYCRGTVYEEDWSRWQAEGQSLDAIWRGAIAMHPAVTEVRDGEAVATAPHLVQFRDALLEAARTCGRRVGNATGRGILHGPTIDTTTLALALAAAPTHPLLRWARRLPPADVVTRVRAALREDGTPPHGDDATNWHTVLAEHEPADPALPGALADVLANLRRWAVDDRAAVG